jgi:hypothetical protein
VVPGELAVTLQPAQQHRHPVELGREVQQQRRDALQLDVLGRGQQGQQLVQPRLRTLQLGQAAQWRGLCALYRGSQLGRVRPDRDQLGDGRLETGERRPCLADRVVA